MEVRRVSIREAKKRIKNATATFSSFTAEPEVIQF